MKNITPKKNSPLIFPCILLFTFYFPFNYRRRFHQITAWWPSMSQHHQRVWIRALCHIWNQQSSCYTTATWIRILINCNHRKKEKEKGSCRSCLRNKFLHDQERYLHLLLSWIMVKCHKLSIILHNSGPSSFFAFDKLVLLPLGAHVR